MLANWMFFWDLVDWQPADPPPPATPEEQPPAPRADAGGGHRDKYEPLGDDYWLARESYLTNELAEEPVLVPKSDTPASPSLAEDAAASGLTQRLSAMEAELEQAVMVASTAIIPQERELAASIAMQLSIDISKLRAQYYERARAIQLLDIF